MFNNHNHNPKPRLTAEEYELRIWGFVVVVVMVVFAGITGSMLYSVIFVTQPIKSMAPIDQAFTKMLNDIVLLIVGGIGGIMSKRAVRTAAEHMAGPQPPAAPSPAAAPTPPTPAAPAPAQVASAMPNFNWMGYQNPDLDESWTPGPPPTTPVTYLDPSREEIAQERAAAQGAA